MTELPPWLERMTEAEAKDRVMKDCAKLIRYRTRAEVAEARLAGARAGIELAMRALRIPYPILTTPEEA